ncbi:hypothetical protein FQZ97_1019440 [compost metagenome]
MIGSFSCSGRSLDLTAEATTDAINPSTSRATFPFRKFSYTGHTRSPTSSVMPSNSLKYSSFFDLRRLILSLMAELRFSASSENSTRSSSSAA